MSWAMSEGRCTFGTYFSPAQSHRVLLQYNESLDAALLGIPLGGSGIPIIRRHQAVCRP